MRTMTTQDAIRRMKDALSRDSARYGDSVRLQAEAFRHEARGRRPLLLSSDVPEQFSQLVPFTYREIHYDPEKMLFNGLLTALASQAGGREAVPSVRANMGVGIVPALFGLVQTLFDDKMPWLLEHLPPEQIREMGPDDIEITPEFRCALDHMEYIAEQLEGTGVRVYPLDIQGAFDTAHLVMGDEIFYQLFDDPGLVHHLLDLCCHAIGIAFSECLKRIPGSGETVAHYSYLAMPRALGGIKLSEDTSTLLSPSAIDEFVKPYMRRALKSAGGGYIHYCGRNDALLRAVLEEPYCRGINFGNPEKHDMEQVLSQCAAARTIYIGSLPGLPGCDTAGYLRRVTRAASGEGACFLMLDRYVPEGDREEWSRAWDACFEEEDCEG